MKRCNTLTLFEARVIGAGAYDLVRRKILPAPANGFKPRMHANANHSASRAAKPSRNG
jgi:hypothetical protein